MKITFLGAAGEVTGSQHLIEYAGRRLLLDCGLFQGHRAQARAKNERFRCDPPKLDAVILSHAHIDHCGNLPGLYRAGFRGAIFATPATADVAAIMLRDSARIQQEDARYLATHLAASHPSIEPLYSEDDARHATRLFETLDYGHWHELSPDVRLRFSDAGHILGSAITELEIGEGSDIRRLVFTGDLGRRNLPLLRDPEPVDGCDVLISECTYGNRVHPPPSDLKAELLSIITRAADSSGRVIIPAFALGRTQQIVYYLNELTEAGLLPPIPVFVDSPLAMRLTDVYRAHRGIFDEHANPAVPPLTGTAPNFPPLTKGGPGGVTSDERPAKPRSVDFNPRGPLHSTESAVIADDDLFHFTKLSYLRSQQESASLNRRLGPFVVISASGMCENGRVRHHLKHAVAEERNTIAIIGFQAEGTLGRALVERQPRVKIFDREYPLRAQVEVLNGLSAHADAVDFKWWFDELAHRGGAGQAFLVHGEPPAARALSTLIRDACDDDPHVPRFGQEFDV
ncbi:MAG: MBL fold metallo-hydrolase [Planctomycetes bacterium]|nr:MBL fold metallo-hydrolase [Planctomycetota bacterium]